MPSSPRRLAPKAPPDPHPSASRPPSPNGRRKRKGKIDPGDLITHRNKLEEGPDADTTAQEKNDGCIKVVINP